jgi:hypothetical protein
MKSNHRSDYGPSMQIAIDILAIISAALVFCVFAASIAGVIFILCVLLK